MKPTPVPFKGRWRGFCRSVGEAAESGRQSAAYGLFATRRSAVETPSTLEHGLRVSRVAFERWRIRITWLNRDTPHRGRAQLDLRATKVAVSLLTWREASVRLSLEFAIT